MTKRIFPEIIYVGGKCDETRWPKRDNFNLM